MRKTKAGIFTLSTSSLMICECLITIVTIFLDTFLVSKLLKLTPGEYGGISIFNFIYYVMMGITVFAMGPILRKVNKSLFLGIGSLLLAGMFVTVYLLGDGIINWIWLLGVLSGVATGVFYAGFNNLITDVISSKHQTIYFSVKNILVFLTKTLFPLVLGSVIDLGSFPLMCVIITVICVLIFVFSFLIKTKKNNTKTFNIINYLKILTSKNEDIKPLKTLYISAIFRGLSFDIIATTLTVLIFLNSGGSDFKIGLIQTIFTATQLISTLIFMKTYHKRRSAWFIFGGLSLIVATSIPVFFMHDMVTLLVFYGAYMFFRIFITTITDMRKGTIIRLLSMHSHSIEYNSVYSLFYGIIRGCSYLLFLLYLVMPEMTMLSIILGVNMLAYIGYGITLYIMEQQLIKQDEKWKKEHPVEVIQPQENDKEKIESGSQPA